MSYFLHTFISFLSSLAIATKCSCFSQHRNHWRSSYGLSNCFPFRLPAVNGLYLNYFLVWWAGQLRARSCLRVSRLPFRYCDMNAMTKSKLGRKALIPVHRLAHPWRAVEAGARNRSLRGTPLTGSLGELSYTAQSHLPRVGTTRSGLGYPIFTSNEGNARQKAHRSLIGVPFARVSLINHQD